MLHKAILAASAIACVSASLLPSLSPFVKTSGPKFQYKGRPYYFAGTNAYWFSFLSDINDVSNAMDQAKAAGLDVIRTWGFNEGTRSFTWSCSWSDSVSFVVNVTTIPDGLPQYGGEGAGPTSIYYQSWVNGTATINYGPNGLPRFDKVVKLAEQKGIKLVVTLTNNCE